MSLTILKSFSKVLIILCLFFEIRLYAANKTIAPFSTSEIAEEPDTVIRIMPLGNSITFGNNVNLQLSADEGLMKSYRAKLWQLLTDKKYPVDFVGSEKTGEEVTPEYDPDNAGFSGIDKGQLLTLLRTGTNPRNGKKVSEGFYLDAYNPSVILLHIGTNLPTESVTEIEDILNEVDAYEARSGIPTLVVLARIIKRIKKSEFDGAPEKVGLYNEALATLAQKRIASGDKLVFVNMETGAGINYILDTENPEGDMADELHPNENGFNKMANVWFTALSDFFGNAPLAPSELSASDESQSSIHLSWKDNSNDEIGFVVERSTSEAGPFTPVASLDAGVQNYLDTDLTLNQPYYYRVKAANQLLYSDYSNLTNFTLTNNIPLAPSDLVAEAISDDKIKVSWVDNSENEEEFVIETSGFSDNGFTVLATLGPNVKTYTHEELEPEKTYFYRVKGKRGSDFSSYSNVDFATTLVTSIEEENFHKSITIFPNPSNDLFNLNIENDLCGMISIQVISSLGKTLGIYNIDKNARTFSTSFNLGGYKDGLYILKITHNNYNIIKKISLK